MGQIRTYIPEEECEIYGSSPADTPTVKKKITLKDRQEERKAILHSYGLGDRVSEEHGDYLKDLLDYHVSKEDRIGSGIDHFTVNSADYGTKSFYIQRTDGSTEDFSASRCVVIKHRDKK